MALEGRGGKGRGGCRTRAQVRFSQSARPHRIDRIVVLPHCAHRSATSAGLGWAGLAGRLFHRALSAESGRTTGGGDDVRTPIAVRDTSRFDWLCHVSLSLRSVISHWNRLQWWSGDGPGHAWQWQRVTSLSVRSVVVSWSLPRHRPSAVARRITQTIALAAPPHTRLCAIIAHTHTQHDDWTE